MDGQRGHSVIKFENKHNGRYYYLQTEKDLFGDWIIHIIRGGISSRRRRIIFCDSLMAVREKIRHIGQIRLKRGYTLIQ